MSDYENTYAQIEREILDLADVMLQNIIDANTPNDQIVQLAASVDLLAQEVNNMEGSSHYTLYLHDSTMITESGYEASNRVFEAINKHLGMNISIRFEQYSDWLPDDPGPFKPKEVPTVSITLTNHQSYLDMITAIQSADSIESIIRYLIFIFLNTLALVQSADRLYDDAYIVQLIKQSSDPDMNELLGTQSEQLTDLIFNEISEVCKKRFNFSTRL